MQWYTLEDGRLCLGTKKAQFANFHIATEIKLNTPLEQPLMPEQIKEIGTFPEDWYHDESIESKINTVAKTLFSQYI